MCRGEREGGNGSVVQVQKKFHRKPQIQSVAKFPYWKWYWVLFWTIDGKTAWPISLTGKGLILSVPISILHTSNNNRRELLDSLSSLQYVLCNIYSSSSASSLKLHRQSSSLPYSNWSEHNNSTPAYSLIYVRGRVHLILSRISHKRRMRVLVFFVAKRVTHLNAHIFSIHPLHFLIHWTLVQRTNINDTVSDGMLLQATKSTWWWQTAATASSGAMGIK